MSLPSSGTASDAIRDIVPPRSPQRPPPAALPRPLLPLATLPPGFDPNGDGQRTRPCARRQIHRPAHPREPAPVKAGGKARMAASR
jgi:hypothetical protein